MSADAREYANLGLFSQIVGGRPVGSANDKSAAFLLLAWIRRQDLPQVLVILVRGEVAKGRTHLAADEVGRSLRAAQGLPAFDGAARHTVPVFERPMGGER